MRAGRAILDQRIADIMDAAHKILGRQLAFHARIGETNLIRDHHIAKNDRHRAALPALHVVGPVQHIRVGDGLVGVAGEAGHAQAVGQHALIRGHPLDAGPRDHADHLLCHRAFRRPHAARRLTKMVFIQLHAQVHLRHGILPVHKIHARQLHIRHGDGRQVEADQQRQDGVGKRRHRHLDLPGILQLLVHRDDLGDQARRLAQDDLLIGLAEVSALGHQGRHRLHCQPIGVEPGHVEQHLQIQVILGGIFAAIVAQLQQLLVAREAGNDPAVGVKEAIQQELLLLIRKLVSRHLGGHPIQVLGPRRQVIELADQAGGQVKRDMDIGVILEHRRHIHVIFGGMHAHPGLEVNAGLRIFVINRLVLVPDNGQVDGLLASRRGGWLPAGADHHRQQYQDIQSSPTIRFHDTCLQFGILRVASRSNHKGLQGLEGAQSSFSRFSRSFVSFVFQFFPLCPLSPLWLNL